MGFDRDVTSRRLAGALLLAAAAMPVDAWAQGGLKDGADCGGFTAADAAAFLKSPAGQVAREVSKAGRALWLCSYAVRNSPPAVAFSVEVAASAKEAAAQLERYREHLMTAGETPRYKGQLPKGAYSDIVGVGDDGVWTDINGVYTVRKGNATVQVTRPKEKLEQLRLAKAVLEKMR